MTIGTDAPGKYGKSPLDIAEENGYKDYKTRSRAVSLERKRKHPKSYIMVLIKVGQQRNLEIASLNHRLKRERDWKRKLPRIISALRRGLIEA